ncbi:AAA family ATPase [Coraliomargarita algicola]|uniref:AAA family ATPase n=1 Tax=Coraliomargarita algicola TaxID=3092156 RepID=A0ABZ0RJI2_9BACT|nr:AAA family ATPase [Coraliomargarita sp. J2-16]WPJ95243.1 AAA family ATPase [Coraliomargarita sp. J2-16]
MSSSPINNTAVASTPREIWEQCPEPDPAFQTSIEPYAPFASDLPEETSTTQAVVTAKPKSFTVLSASELLARVLPVMISILGNGIIVMGQLISILGQGGTGKSRFVMQLAIFQVLGRDFVGFKTHPKPLKHLFIGTENSIHRQQSELRKMTAGFTDQERELLGQYLFFHVVEGIDDAFINLGSPEIVQKWQLTLEQIQPDCVFVDPFGEVVIGDINKDADVRHTLRELTRICRRHNHDTAIIVVHHARTGRGNIAQAVGYDRGNFGLGSKALYSGVRSQLNLAPADPDDSSRIVLSCGKSNDTKPFKPMGLKLNETTMTYEVDSMFDVDAWLADVEGTQRGQAASVADAVRAVQAGSIRYADIVKAVVDDTACSPATAKRRIKEAVHGGYLRKRTNGDYVTAKPLPTPAAHTVSLQKVSNSVSP